MLDTFFFVTETWNDVSLSHSQRSTTQTGQADDQQTMARTHLEVAHVQRLQNGKTDIHVIAYTRWLCTLHKKPRSELIIHHLKHQSTDRLAHLVTQKHAAQNAICSTRASHHTTATCAIISARCEWESQLCGESASDTISASAEKPAEVTLGLAWVWTCICPLASMHHKCAYHILVWGDSDGGISNESSTTYLMRIGGISTKPAYLLHTGPHNWLPSIKWDTHAHTQNTRTRANTISA